MKKFGLFLSILLIAAGVGAHTQANALDIVRSTLDRVDDLQGYQIHVVYVVPKGSSDLKYDTNGFLDNMSKDAQRWLREKSDRQLKIDTYQGQLDVTFLQSKYSVSELCNDECDTLELLIEELQEQDSSFDGSKTVYFSFSESLDEDSCGWALNTSALALGYSSADSCNKSSAFSSTGISGVAKTFIHEIFHTYGVNHVCGDNSELMIGSPECEIDFDLYGYVKTTLDTSRSNYFGGNRAGVDILKMPIWQSESSDISESALKQISESRYLQTIKGGLVVARSGFRSESFEWEWNKKFSPSLFKSECVMESELGKITGDSLEYECYFNVPKTWDVGMDFTVHQEITVGPFNGVASTPGKIAREDYSVNACTEDTCFVGGRTTVDTCWTPNTKKIILQKIVNGRWQNLISTNASIVEGQCGISGFPKYTEAEVTLNVNGNSYFRWVSPADANSKEFRAKPFAIIGHPKHQAEPTSLEIKLANALALKLGAEADQLGSRSIKTMTCVNQKNNSKKVTGISPICPTGFKPKK